MSKLAILWAITLESEKHCTNEGTLLQPHLSEHLPFKSFPSTSIRSGTVGHWYLMDPVHSLAHNLGQVAKLSEVQLTPLYDWRVSPASHRVFVMFKEMMDADDLLGACRQEARKKVC